MVQDGVNRLVLTSPAATPVEKGLVWIATVLAVGQVSLSTRNKLQRFSCTAPSSLPPAVPLCRWFAVCRVVNTEIALSGVPSRTILQGASWPLWSLLFGEAISKFSDPQTLSDTMSDLAILMSSIGVGIGVITAIHNVIFTDVALKCAARTRTKFLEAVLSQDMDW